MLDSWKNPHQPQEEGDSRVAEKQEEYIKLRDPAHI